MSLTPRQRRDYGETKVEAEEKSPWEQRGAE